MAKGIDLFFFFSSPETLSFLIWKRLEFLANVNTLWVFSYWLTLPSHQTLLYAIILPNSPSTPVSCNASQDTTKGLFFVIGLRTDALNINEQIIYLK